jgi:hypothetical protein
MTTNLDWLPKNNEDLYAQLEQTWLYLEIHENRVRMGLEGKIGAWIDNEFGNARKVYIDAFTVWQDKSTRTSRATRHLKEAEAKLKPLFCTLYTSFLKENPFVTNEDLLAMDLPIRLDIHRSATSIPSFPIGIIEAGPAGVLVIHFRDSEAKSRVKPQGVVKIEIRWGILDKIPHDWNQLVNSSFYTRTPFRISFESSQRGKTFYCSLRWENIRGGKGSWSPIFSAIIP